MLHYKVYRGEGLNRSFPSGAGSTFSRNILAALAFSVAIVGLVVAFVTATPTIIKYLYSDGSCAIVVDYTDGKRVGHDCGWEKDRNFSTEYVSEKLDLSTLHGDK